MTLEERERFGVLYVGAGELTEALQLKARMLRNVKVHFAGFKNQTELPPYYLASDILVLPSRQMGETWGLVVNEALLAERRVIVSQFAGCHADFAQAPGVRVFDGTTEGLTAALRQLLPTPPRGVQREFMRHYSVSAAAEGIASAMGSISPTEVSDLNLPAKRIPGLAAQ
jgi:glycosyltransferase involved in cell wall biosynthesis